MRVGVGLPTAVDHCIRENLLDWALCADLGGFTSVATIDRLAADVWEPLITLAAVAAVTHHVRLVTSVIAGPLRNTSLLAKQVATLDEMSLGRVVLGLGVGQSLADYRLGCIDTVARGARLSEQLVRLRETWERSGDGPAAWNGKGPTLLIGGSSSAAFARAACHADGWLDVGGTVSTFSATAGQVRAAWSDFGRPGRPQLWGRAHYVLGDEPAAESGREHVLEYYRGLGRDDARELADGLLTTRAAISDCVRDYAGEGCDELLLLPAISRIDQMERLADLLQRHHQALLGGGVRRTRELQERPFPLAQSL